MVTARAAGIELVRRPLEPASEMTWRPAAAVGQVLLAASYRLAARGTPAVRHAENFRGFALTGRRDFTARLLPLPERLGPGLPELMVPPAYPDGPARAAVGYPHGAEPGSQGA